MINTLKRLGLELGRLKLAIALALLTGIGQADAVTIFPIATSPATVSGSGIAFDGTNYLVEMLGGGTNVSVQLVSASGALLGSQTVVGGGSSFQTAAGLVFGQTNYLVAWSDSTVSSGVDMFGQFISRGGATVGSRFNLLQAQGSHGVQYVRAVASDGTNFLVVWADSTNSVTQTSGSYYGQLVTPAGTLSGPEFLISGQQGNGNSAAVTFGRTNYLVVWQSNNGNNGNTNQAFGEFISKNGVAGSPFQIGQTASADQSFLAVAFDGTNYLAVWPWDPGPETGMNVTNWQFYGRVVSPTGTFPGSELALITSGNLVIPALAFDGANYLLAYGFDSNTTNADRNLRCQFLDRSADLIGSPFAPFAAQGTNVPLIALHGILFDGSRFVLAGTLGNLGTSGEVYGGFIPASTAPPALAPAGAPAGTQFPLQLTGTPGIAYVIQASATPAAKNWEALGTNTASATGTFNFTDASATGQDRFYRAMALYEAVSSVSYPPAPAGMAVIPAGLFTLGDTLDDESDAVPTNVDVSVFFMDTNLVSYSQWLSVYYWATTYGYSFDNPGSGIGTNEPVQTVNWYDVVKWCNARSQQAGLTPVYYTDAGLTQVYTNGDVDAVYVNWAGAGYRLPTEAEWEKAARGGLSGQRFPQGNAISESLANYYGSVETFDYDLGPDGYNASFEGGQQPYTSPVGSFAPNGYGLYDMAGNLFEWCWDWYGTPYAGGSDPRGPQTGSSRVLRSGSWGATANYIRCANRISASPSDDGDVAGFRCVRGH